MMKNPFLRFELLIAIGCLTCSACFGEEPRKDDEKRNQDVVISQDRNTLRPTRPRMPARQNIACMYEACSESLVFEFFDDMGSVAITVMNTATGEMFFDGCSSTPGACRSALSGDSGHYTILLEDDRGHTYTGAFEL